MTYFILNLLKDDSINLDKFGELLDYEWKLKKKTGSAVSTDYIDYVYEKGKAAGALGGKLLGAGGGGFLIFYVRPEFKEEVKETVQELMHIPFLFENAGTKIIYYTPENYEPRKK